MTFETHCPRIMICEDEPLSAMYLAAFIEAFGCQTVGPFRSIREARAAMRTEQIDAAILDIELDDGASTPIAGALRETGVPFIVLSGLRTTSPPPEFAGVEWLDKPVDEERLRAFCAAAPALPKSAPSLAIAEPAMRPMV